MQGLNEEFSISEFIESQTHFGMPRDAKMTLVLNELKLIAIQSNSNTTSELAPQVKRSIVFVCKTTSGNLRGSTPDERSHLVRGQL